eukprot:superscaffoldBa00000001_g11
MSANNTVLVNSVQVPESDIMATNGVIHFVNQVLYPGDIPVGSTDLLTLLKKLITYMQIKYISGFRYQEIPLTFMVTRYVQEEPTITKVTRVIETEPTITKVTRVIEAEPPITKVTRIVSGPQYSVSTGTNNIALEGVDLSEIGTIETNPNFDADSLTKMIQAGSSRRTASRRNLAGNRRRGRD